MPRTGREGPEIHPNAPAPPSGDRAEFPRVSWPEIEAHLVGRLMIEPRWALSGERSLTWWPWFLAQEFSVVASGTWGADPDDNFVTVTARTPVARAPEEVGLALCAAANATLALGAFVWKDGVITAAASVSLTPLCRGLLSLFHEAALAQAITAHDLAVRWREQGEQIEVLTSAHPGSGLRDQPGELLLGSSAGPRAEGVEGLSEVFPELDRARALYRRGISAQGWTATSCDDWVDVFDSPGDRLLIGRPDGSPEARQHGPGLAVVVPITSARAPFDAHQMNRCALAMLEHPTTSLLASVRTDPRRDGFGTHLYSYLTRGFLAESGRRPQDLARTVQIAALHTAAAVSQFRTAGRAPADLD